jgi:hypothetical protein
VDVRVLEAAKLVRTAYMKQRANDSRGFWTMMRELVNAVWAMEQADAAETAVESASRRRAAAAAPESAGVVLNQHRHSEQP